MCIVHRNSRGNRSKANDQPPRNCFPSLLDVLLPRSTLAHQSHTNPSLIQNHSFLHGNEVANAPAFPGRHKHLLASAIITHTSAPKAAAASHTLDRETNEFTHHKSDNNDINDYGHYHKE